MDKHKAMTETERAAELAKLDLRSPSEASKRTNGLLRTMLNTPPDPHVQKSAKRAKK
ncbi:MAG TPA: hypothetical protein VGR63_09510 [Casimicrobiaceae bacterium]|jgi:hypothetical protein|nr:hypothetical protein [Casimicrobiaceae bacterium]